MTMSKKLYVGNLSFSTTASDLRGAFEQFGAVNSADVVLDRDTGRSRGFGFVEMSNGAEAAIKSLDSSELDGRRINVNEAREREERRPASYGGRRY
jgi:RNA recognition motif-containing protein